MGRHVRSHTPSIITKTSLRVAFLLLEHYGIITDIAAIFKVTATDTSLFVRISCTVLYVNSVLSVVDRIE